MRMIKGLAQRTEAAAPMPVVPCKRLTLDASIALARLDERLACAPEPVRTGWISRALIHEAAASLRLNGFYVTAHDLMLILEDSLDRVPDQDLGRAIDIHRMLTSLSRRQPRHLFSPRRLLVLTSLRLRGKPFGHPDLPGWLQKRRRDPKEISGMLDEALWPSVIAGWEKLPPLEAAGEIIAHWHATGAADGIGAAPGRALSMAWIHRVGLTSGYYFLPAVGFLGHARDYRPDLEVQWPRLFMEACGRAADWGLKLHMNLTSAHRRLHEAAPRQRSTSYMRPLVDLLVASPALSAKKAANQLQITPHAARAMLGTLAAKGLVHEVTGRGSFRLYTIIPLIR